MLALDGREYELTSEMCVIADEDGVESIAGIMGGEHSGCDENTTDVLIESALWEPLNIARTGRELGIITDARYRFERGVESHGMMCSERELELSDEHNGIIDLPEDAPVGTSFAAYAKLDDPVIEINLTPNRPDATSVHGIARDLAASGLGRLTGGAIMPHVGNGICPVKVKLDFGDTPPLCHGFALRLIRGVKNGHSPKWLQQRLIAIGLRPINALVDITNYITFDRGRPLHVFDAKKVKGDLVVRRAKGGE